MFDAIVLSDLHLGAPSCQVDDLLSFLDTVPPTKQLILNGDVLESVAYQSAGSALRVLARLQQLAEQTEVIWIGGNHDYDAERVARSIGAEFIKTEYRVESGAKTILCIHGHQWDRFLSDHPWLTIVVDFLYLWMQRVSRRLAVRAKRSTRTFQRCVARVRTEAVKYGRLKKVDAVVCGHVHEAEMTLPQKRRHPIYCNTGSWVDVAGCYLTIQAGQLHLVMCSR